MAGGAKRAVVAEDEPHRGADERSEDHDLPEDSRRQFGISRAGLLSLISFSWAGPLIKWGAVRELNLRDGKQFFAKKDEAVPLASGFDAAWAKASEAEARRPPGPPSRVLYRTLLALHWPNLLFQSFWAVTESALRLAGPVLLRELLDWLAASQAFGGANAPLWKGWVLVAGLSVQTLAQALVHHQLFWVGMRMGLHMRTQTTLAVHDKVLRLNSAAVSDFSVGKVVNLVSNDSARFDEALIMWPFLWAGPLELVAVIFMLAAELGWVPALAGAAALLVLVPFQAWLSKYIHKLRAASTKVTDERVRLTGEVIGGALAMKMHSWEYLLAEKLQLLRREECRHKGKTAQINAGSFALQFALTPIITLATFAATRAMAVQLDVALVFYAIALLHLPKLYVATFFVRGVQTVTELRVAVTRIAEFLTLQEPTLPSAAPSGDTAQPSVSNGVEVEEVAEQAAPNPLAVSEALQAAPLASAEVAAVEEVVSGGAEEAAVVMAGGDYSWDNWSGGVEAAGAAAADGGGDEGLGSRRGGKVTLHGVEVAVKRGELLGICGEVGAGKSSLLAALLGEMQPIGGGGGARMDGRIAYCSQVPWVMAATVEDNVLFGRAKQDKRYQLAVESAALAGDIAHLPAGDQTELGERGINLSGGQKARVALARAAYSGADIMLLDDPLSAVDSKVGRHIFHKCISNSGIMAGATRLLVTHQKHFLPLCDRIMVLRKGRVEALGTWAELGVQGIPELQGVQDMGAQASIEDDPEEAAKPALAGTAAPALQPSFSVAVEEGMAAKPQGGGSVPKSGSNGSLSRLAAALSFKRSSSHGSLSDAEGELAGGASQRLRYMLSVRTRGKAPPARGDDSDSAKAGALVKEEGRASGGVTWRVYWEYVKYCGALESGLILGAIVAGAGVWFYTQFWVGLWGAAPVAEQGEAYWVEMLAILTGVCIVLTACRSALFFDRTLKAASKMHDRMAIAVMRSPLRFFHTNPTGRVLNRFSRDLGLVDDMLPQVMIDTLQLGFVIIGALVLVMLAAWPVIVILVPLTFAFFWYRKRYVRTSREVKRMEAVSRSPVYASFSAMLKGLPTVRAYNAQAFFHKSFTEHQNINTSWYFCFLATARWIGFRMDMMSALTLIGVSVGAMLLRTSLSLALLGVALTNTLELSAMMQWTVRQSAEVENNMTATERLIEYTKLPREAPTCSEGGAAPPDGWPFRPAPDLCFDGLTATYGSHLMPVLKGLSFTIPAGTSCGIVGRTGSGKSSLMLTLFRLIHTTEGALRIGGTDVASIGVDALRRQLAIIPQDPVLFSGSLRFNLDPFGTHTDSEMWEVLRLVRLAEEVGPLGGLDARMSEGGENWSVGQRQLLCLARALLQDAAILALDEATANVDRATDAAIQSALREVLLAKRANGAKRTVLVIAHRIDTIMDCDTLVVLSRGEVVEMGPPPQLLAKPGGVFAGYVAAATAGGMATGVPAVAEADAGSASRSSTPDEPDNEEEEAAEKGGDGN